MIVRDIQFDTAFQALTDHSPLRWQRRLFACLRSGRNIPRACDLPTGLGKTYVIPIWLIALAQQAQNGSSALPRRLVYIVNRRTVVDQATSVVEQIRQRLLAPDDPCWSKHEQTLRSVGEALQRLASTEKLLLAVSTLRGELADNEEWKADPARPAIIVGTIDMVGSKLLFSGYGDGRYWRVQHAALIGQDSLIIHDEAHLTPAFGDMLHHVAEVQRQAHEQRPVRVMDLSATSRGGGGPVLKLEPDDEKDELVKQRLQATKRLHLHRVEEASQVINQLVELSKTHDDERAKVLIYVRSPEDAHEVANQLNRQLSPIAMDRIALLTGTIRGHERDQLIRTDPVYQALLDPQFSVGQTVYLVSTSAGEVGINIDADHMVCDLTTLESLIQRLGRVNRRGGEGRVARVDVVVHGDAKSKDKPSEHDRAIHSTLTILNRWLTRSGGVLDVSPRGLHLLMDNDLSDEERRAAFEPKPAVPPFTDILLDAWSLTSIMNSMPGRLRVTPYLHGLTIDPPETYIAWRKEVNLLHQAEVDSSALRAWFRACRVESRERLRGRTDRVNKALADLLKAHGKMRRDPDFPIVLLDERGEAEWSRLSRIVEKGFNLEYRTIVIPVEAGGLDTHGMLDSGALELIPNIDVAEATTNGDRRERWLHIRTQEGERYERLLTGETAGSVPPKLREQERIRLTQLPEGAEDEGESRDLVLLASPRQLAFENPETAKIRQTLHAHTSAIVVHAGRIGESLSLDDGLKHALVAAAEWHDRGKDRPAWQRYACNHNGTEPLAKSDRYLSPSALGGYRHEFGSLLEAISDLGLKDHPERELVLHLIASHHGHARPHVGLVAFDHTCTSAQNEDAAGEVLRRFGRLQQRFGHWGLAWLESLLRCADIAASKQAVEPLASQSQELEV